MSLVCFCSLHLRAEGVQDLHFFTRKSKAQKNVAQQRQQVSSDYVITRESLHNFKYLFQSSGVCSLQMFYRFTVIQTAESNLLVFLMTSVDQASSAVD